MGSSTTIARGTPSKVRACRLLVHPEEGLPATLQFVVAGLEAGQQVFAMAGPARLKELAHCLGQGGLRPETLLHNRRLVFLTAPDCVSRFLKQGDPFRRGSLLRNGSLLRWVSDWSWACPSRSDLPTVLRFQRRIHDFVHSIPALSLCTVDGEKMERSSLLALLADHRRAVKIYMTQGH
jgi:hypothetical protein